MMYFGDQYVRRIYLGGTLLKEFPAQGNAPFGMQGLLMTTALGSPTLSEVAGAVLISPAGLSMTPLMSSTALTLSSVAGIAYIEAEGQSNVVGFNSVDALSISQHKTFADVQAYEVVSGLGTTSTVVSQASYTIVPLGDTIDGVAGRQGERNVGASSGGVTPTYGLIKAADDGSIWTNSTGRWLLKAATSGTLIDEFLPINAAGVWKNKVYGMRKLRADLDVETDPVFYQAKVWWQGEANTNAPRAAANLSHPDITEYAGKFEQVYAFDVAQKGVQPPWFLCALLSESITEGVDDIYTAAINDELRGLCRYTVALNGAITDNGSGNVNRYYVDHGLNNPGDKVHAREDQQQQIGAAIATALQTIQGADGYSSALPLLPRPVVLGITTGTISAGSVALTLTTTDVGTVYTASVPAGSATPTTDQIKNGGGAVTARTSQVFSGLFAPGSTLGTTLTGIPTGGSVDIHAVLTDVLDSVPQSVTGIAIPAPSLGWDDTYQTAFLTYSDDAVQANNTPGGNRYPRSAISRSTGKRCFDIDAIGNLVFAGLGHPGTAIAGGSSDASKVGWLTSNLVSSQANVPMGANASTNATIRIAVDLDARLLWVAGDAGLWNNNASANPATSVGGVTISGLPTDAVPLAGLGAGTANGATLDLSPATRPAGFGTWA